MRPIALDAMGGDHAPDAMVEGARRAIVDYGIPVVLVGDPLALGETDGLEVIEASETIAMDEDPGPSVRRKKDASIVRAAEAVRDGRCGAVLSAGNTGAAMAASLFRLGRLKGVKRPAIATPIPTLTGTPTVLLDSGANADCQPPWLVQFAQMGAAYAATRYEIEDVRIGLLSIGEEAGKGNTLTKEAFELLEAAEWAGPTRLRFIGNVEGRDLMSDLADVVVTDGFTGNVALKTLEGGVGTVLDRVREVVGSDPTRLASDPALDAGLAQTYEDLDPDTYGAALLLGVNGLSLVSHGSSGPAAITNALRTAAEILQSDLVAAVHRAVGR